MNLYGYVWNNPINWLDAWGLYGSKVHYDKTKEWGISVQKPSSVNRKLACLKCMFNKAIEWSKFNGDNTVKKVKLFKENNKRLRFLEKDEIIKLLENSKEHLVPIIIIALNTGMRKSEILKLRWMDMDIKRNIITILETKNGRKREVFMNDYVKTALLGIERHSQSNFVFTKKDGTPLGNIKRTFFTACKKSGIKDFKFHDLRHSFASHLVMSGIDLNTVRELLGHQSIQMILRYSHLSQSHKKQAVDVLGSRMDTIWSPGNISNKGGSKKKVINV
jgi:integrase